MDRHSPPIWGPPAWEPEDVGRKKPNLDVDRKKADSEASSNSDVFLMVYFLILAFIVVLFVLNVCKRDHIDPIGLVGYVVRRSWNNLVEAACWYWMQLAKYVRWMCCVKTERPVQQQPQESGVELQPVSCPPPNDGSSPTPNDTSTRPPEDASSPPQGESSSRYRSSDGSLSTLREESSASSTQTVVETSADTEAASSA